MLIVGAGGQLGIALHDRYPDARAAGRAELDIADPDALAAFDWTGVDVVVNAAAYTNVDRAQTPDGRAAAWRVNAAGAANLARVALERGLTLVHVSTDYVFDGTRSPHREDEPVAPLGVYGQSKAAGEFAVQLVEQHYLLRTSWVVGAGKNFVRTMLAVGQGGTAPTVVADQIGRLTFATELARAIGHLLEVRAPYGTYHVSNSGPAASWADVTREIFRCAGLDLPVSETSTAEYFASRPDAAPRPLASTFDLGKLEATGFAPADWREDLQRYVLKELSR